MPDISNRDALERKFARLVRRLLGTYGGELLDALGDPPDLQNVPPGFWDEQSAAMIAELQPVGEQIYLEAAKDTGVGIIPNLTSFFDSAMLAIGVSDSFYMFYDDRPLLEGLMDTLL